MASSGVTIHIPYDSTQFDYYLKLSISIISIQLSKILMFFFFNSYNMIHNVDNIQPETLNLRIHCTIVIRTLLIYNKDVIKKKCNFLVFFFLDLEHSHISKKIDLSKCSLRKHDLWADTRSPAEEKTLSLTSDVAGTHL